MEYERYGASTYGDRVADVYDDWYGAGFEDVGPVVDFLAGLAGPGPALELGIGTGRVALPLAARGVDVHGLDASEAMVARLRAKPGGETMPVTIGDMADVAMVGEFALVFVVFNTLFGLLTQDDQVHCFENVAARLAPGGRFVVQAFVPDVSRFDRGQRTHATRVDVEEVHLEASSYDAAAQRVDSAHIVIRDGDVRIVPIRIRFAWPSELDLMARLAGLHLEHRFGGWRREPVTASSPAHVSVYRRS